MSLRSSGRLKARVIQGARRGRWLFLISYFFFILIFSVWDREEVVCLFGKTSATNSIILGASLASAEVC